MATLMGIVGLPILPLLHVESLVVEQQPVPTFGCAQLVTEPQLGKRLAAALGDHRVCHLQGHGIVSVGESVQEATLGAIHLERLAEVNYRVALLGREPRVIPADELQALKRHLASPAGRWAYYGELASQ
jgi:L-fuculose-phosphate aldolase